MTIGERVERLPERLAGFKPKSIKSFNKILRKKWNQAYRTDVWALAYLLRGGCSDDAFMDFRAWLIMQGRQVFEQTSSDPDSFEVARSSSGSLGCISNYRLKFARLAESVGSWIISDLKLQPARKITGPWSGNPEQVEAG
jgi:hypothetical protein